MRVAVTRPKERAEKTLRLIEDRGWSALIVPTIEISPRDKSDVLAAVGSLTEYDWLVLTSAFGAEIFYDCFGKALKDLNIAVIGSKTREALEGRGIDVHLTPSSYKAEDLASGLLSKGIGGKKILLARASIAREVLKKELGRVADVKEVVLYDASIPKDRSGTGKLETALGKGEVDAIIFTSSQSARNLLEMSADIASKLGKVLVCAIGPITAETLGELGVKVDVVSEVYTIEGALNSLEERLKDG